MNLGTATAKPVHALKVRLDALPIEQRRALADLPAVKYRLGASCTLTKRQVEAERLLESSATHVMLFGGSRSGKTFLIVRQILKRALAHKSRHAILRFRFNHVVATIALACSTSTRSSSITARGSPPFSQNRRASKAARSCIVSKGARIISGGLNVYPAEIENALDALPAVGESAVIGLPHPDFGEAVTAIVTAREGREIDENAIRSLLAGVLAPFKIPKRVLVKAELPRNAMGKVQKNALREEFAGLYLD